MLKNPEKPLWRALLLLLIPGLLLFAAWHPVSAAAGTHQVAQNETLFLIAQKYNTTVTELINANKIANPALIYPGQILTIPSNAASGDSSALASRAGSFFNTKYSPQELDLLARLVHAEAAGEPYVGQVAVAATVLNRVQSSRYPNSIAGVIYQVINGHYQYSPVLDGRINLPADQRAYQAVYDALGGWDPTKGALGFYNPHKTSNQWVRQQQVTTVIGNHIFFR